MSRVEERLKELGLELPPCPVPVAAYVPAAEAGSFVFASGQTAIVDGVLQYKGKLGKDVSVEEGYQSARIAGLRVISELKAILGDLDRIERIVKVTGYVNGTPDFADQPKVVNGASELFREVFGEKGEHSRVAVGAGSLPDGASVEIYLIAYVK